MNFYKKFMELILKKRRANGEGTIRQRSNGLWEISILDGYKPNGKRNMKSFYGLLFNGKTAVIEMAACAGLPLVENRKNPMLATTYGVGLLIKDAIEKGVEEIILGLGGSATNDFGCGAAAALGVRFLNKKGEQLLTFFYLTPLVPGVGIPVILLFLCLNLPIGVCCPIL